MTVTRYSVQNIAVIRYLVAPFTSLVYVQVSFLNLSYLFLHFFLAGQGPVGKAQPHTPILKIMFENIIMTFDAEIHKIFKNIQPQSKIRRSSKKECKVWKPSGNRLVVVERLPKNGKAHACFPLSEKILA